MTPTNQTPEPVSNELPPLPEPKLWHDKETGHWKVLTKPDRPTYEPHYTADQMRDYARAAIAAKPEPVSGERGELIERCREILDWQKTGTLKGDALRSYAQSKYGNRHDALQCAESDTAREAYAALLAADAQRVEPDMFWNDADAEQCFSSIDEFLNDEICNASLRVGDVRTLLQAVRLPNVKIKVTSIDDESCEAEYEVIDTAAHGVKEKS